MSSWTIYGANGVAKAVVKELELHDEWMAECFLTVTVKSHEPIDFEIGDYIDYRDERYSINYDPTILKKARRDTYGEGFVYDNIKFVSVQDEIVRCDFNDIVLSDNNMHYTMLPTFPFYCENVEDLLDRVQANLEELYPGGWIVIGLDRDKARQRGMCVGRQQAFLDAYTRYIGDVSFEYEKTGVALTADNNNCWEALRWANEQFDLNFFVRGRVVVVGTNGAVTGRKFRYGKGNGLYEIERISDSEQKIITRLRGYGAETNLPNRYYATIGQIPYADVESIYETGSSDNPYVDVYLDVNFSKSMFKYSAEHYLSDGTHITDGYVVKVSIDDIEVTAKATEWPDTKRITLWIEYKAEGSTDPSDEPDINKVRAIMNAMAVGKRVYFLEYVDKAAWPTDHLAAESSSGEQLPDNMAINRLMLPGFPKKSLQQWVEEHMDYERVAAIVEEGFTFSDNPLRPWIDSYNKDIIGIRPASIYFDGNGENEDIHPTIEEMEWDGRRVDVVVSADQITDNGYISDTNGEVKESDKRFTMVIPNAGFDFGDLFKKDETTISMKDGMCGARNFKVMTKPTQDEVTKNWTVVCEREYDETLKIYFPYCDFQIRGGDHFVILGIDLPKSYVDAASEKLFFATIDALRANHAPRFTFQPRIDEIWMQRQHDTAMASGGAVESLHDTLKSGDLFSFADDDLGIDAKIIIDILTIKENGNNGIPTYEVTLRDEKIASTLDKKLDKITSVISGVGGGMTSRQYSGMIEAEGSDLFLSKIYDDVAQGVIGFLKGVWFGVKQWFIDGNGNANFNDTTVNGLLKAYNATINNVRSSNYTGDGIADTGWKITNEYGNGDSYAVFDRLYIRKNATFEELEIRRLSHAGGNVVLSPASGRICRVDYYDGSGNLLGYEEVTVPWTLFGRLMILFSPHNANNRYLGRKKLVQKTLTDAEKAAARTVRCYMFTDDGSTDTMAGWTVDALARCQTFNINTQMEYDGSSWTGTKVGNTYWWRRVRAVGNQVLSDGNKHDWVEFYVNRSDMSQDCDLGSDLPSVGDVMAQFGHWTRPELSAVVTLESYRGDIRGFREYDQIMDFNLNNKDWVSIGYDASTGRAISRIYGDFYYGARDESTYVKYNAQTAKLDIKAIISISSPLGDSGVNLGEFMRTVAGIDQHLDDVTNSGIISGGTEKQQLRSRWLNTVEEYKTLVEQIEDYYGSQAEVFIVPLRFVFTNLATMLNNGVSPSSAILNGTTLPNWINDTNVSKDTVLADTPTKNRTTYDATWEAYINQAYWSRSGIAEQAKVFALNAQSSADQALAKLSDIANDGKLDPSEKQEVKREFEKYYHEMMDSTGILDKAKDNNNNWIIDYNTWIKPYIDAFNAVGTYLNGGTSWTKPELANFSDNTLPSWIKAANMGTTNDITSTTWLNLWSSFYSKRTAVLTTLTEHAQSSADTAYAEAIVAQNTASRIIDDGIIMHGKEKSDLLIEWQRSIAEYKKYMEQAEDYFGTQAATKTAAYVTAYTNLAKMLNNGVTPSDAILNGTAWPAWLNSTGINQDTVISETPTQTVANYRAIWSAYYTQLNGLLEEITKKAKALADDAQITANSATESAAAALSKLADMASDSKLDSSEKQEVKKEFENCYHEMMDSNGILAKAKSGGTYIIDETTWITPYKNAFAAIGKYLNNGTAWSIPNSLTNSTMPSWIKSANMGTTNTISGDTWRSLWSTFYTARAAVLTTLTEHAQSTANTAQTSAAQALAKISDMASDSKFDPSEKQEVKKEFENCYHEMMDTNGILAKAKSGGVYIIDEATWITPYRNSFAAIGKYLNGGAAWSIPSSLTDSSMPSWIKTSNMSTTNDIAGDTWRSLWSTFYTARAAVLTTLTEHAQTSADNALSKISDMASDSKLDPSEKQEVKKDFEAYYHEMKDTYGILDKAKDANDQWIIGYNTWIKPYEDAFADIGKYLNGGTAWSIPSSLTDSTMPSWIKNANMGTTNDIAGSTWRNLWNTFFTKRSAVLTTLTEHAQTSADNAKSAADAAQGTANGAVTAAQLAQQKADSMEYLKTALGLDTTITGGLILSTIIALRDGSNRIWSGMNGIYSSGDSLAAWYGGETYDIIRHPEYKTSSYRYAKGVIRMDGTGYFAGGNIVWESDGRGYVAGGNIAWDANGNIVIKGNTVNPSVQVEATNVEATKVDTTKFYLNGVDITDQLNAVLGMFELVTDSNNVTWVHVKNNRPFYSDSDISALGQSSGGGGGGGTSVLNDLNDVIISSPQNGQALVYDSVSSKWKNQVVSGGGGGSLATLSDVNIGNQSDGQVLAWNASQRKWIASSVSGGLSMTEVWAALAADTLSQINISHLTTALTGYAKTADLNITNWNTAYTNSHTHSNKSVLDGISSTDVSHWGTAYTNNHTHSNKSVLDGISSDKVSHWDTAYGWGNHANAGYAYASALNNYLPLSGGTLTGSLQVNATIFGYNYSNSNNAAAFVFDKPGSNYTGIGANGVSDQIYFGACNADGTWVDYSQKWYFNGDVRAAGNIRANGSLQGQSVVIEQTNEINSYDGALHLNYRVSGNMSLVNGGGNVGIGTTSPSYKLQVSGDIYATGDITAASDGRQKEVVEDAYLTLEQIAEAPAVKFTWKDKRDKDVHAGTIAQYWQDVLPEVVTDRDDSLGMNYGAAAMVSSINLAREVVELRKMVVELKKEVERLKSAS